MILWTLTRPEKQQINPRSEKHCDLAHPGDFLAPSPKPLLCLAVVPGCQPSHFLSCFLSGERTELSVQATHARREAAARPGHRLQPKTIANRLCLCWFLAVAISCTPAEGSSRVCCLPLHCLVARNGCHIHALVRHAVDRPGCVFSTRATVSQL